MKYSILTFKIVSDKSQDSVIADSLSRTFKKQNMTLEIYVNNVNIIPGIDANMFKLTINKMQNEDFKITQGN